MKNLLELINKVLESNEIDPINSIEGKMNLRDDLGFDSFMLAELTVEIEDSTGIDIFENGVIYTISDIVNKLND